MESIEKMLAITKIGILPHSDYWSSEGVTKAAMRASREWALALLEEGATDNFAERVIKSVNPTPAHVAVYTLGCGLPFGIIQNRYTGERLTDDCQISVSNNPYDGYVIVPSEREELERELNRGDVPLRDNILKIDGLEVDIRRIKLDWDNPNPEFFEILGKLLSQNPNWNPVWNGEQASSRLDSSLNGYTLNGYKIGWVYNGKDICSNRGNKLIEDGDKKVNISYTARITGEPSRNSVSQVYLNYSFYDGDYLIAHVNLEVLYDVKSGSYKQEISVAGFDNHNYTTEPIKRIVIPVSKAFYPEIDYAKTLMTMVNAEIPTSEQLLQLWPVRFDFEI